MFQALYLPAEKVAGPPIVGNRAPMKRARVVVAAGHLRSGAVMPVLLEGLVVDDELVRICTRTASTVGALIDAAHQSGRLRPDVDGDLLHRHLDLALDDLVAAADRPAVTEDAGRPQAGTHAMKPVTVLDE